MKPRNRTSENRRFTIGYLSPALHGGSQRQWTGIAQAAHDHNINLIGFPGWSLHDARGFQAQANILYDLVNGTHLDGIITWASALGNYTTADVLADFHARFVSLPVVTIGKSLPGMPGVLMDSYEGMREAIIHLIERHGCRRIAFIRGPESHLYAQQRYQAYVDTLAAHGVALDMQLVTPPSHWGSDIGGEMTRMLLDERGLVPQRDLDAIIAANDDLLLGVLEVLRARQIAVPEAVALVGFDNRFEGRITSPPLTTVDAPFHDAGYRAVETLLSLLNGETVPHETLIPSRLVVRQSCGCVSSAVTGAAASGSMNDRVPGETHDSQADIHAVIMRAIGEERLKTGRLKILLEGFSAELNGGPAGSFLSALEQTLYHLTSTQQDVTLMQGTISELRRKLLPYLHGPMAKQAEDLWQQARVAVAEAIMRAQAREQWEAELQAEMLQTLGASLITTFDIEELMQTLAEGLPRLGIPGVYLSIYENPQLYQYPDAMPQQSRLILAVDEQQRITLPAEGQAFESRRLLPQDSLPQSRRFTFIAKPLYFRKEQLGFALLEADAALAATCDTLAGQISSALQGALLMMQTRQQAFHLDSAVRETLITAQEIQVTVTETAGQARSIAVAAQQSVDVSQSGQAALDAMIAGMEAIEQRVDQIVQNITAFSGYTHQIGEILDAVNEIADMSKLLALNANIEAARAGDAGRGFSVVAREMRHLAEQSRAATSRVHDILTEIQAATSATVTVSKDGSEEAQRGMTLATQAASAIRDLAATIEEAAQATTQIATITQQQTTAMDQLVAAMQSIQQTSEQNILLAEMDSV